MKFAESVLSDCCFKMVGIDASTESEKMLRSIEICAGAGGRALGLEQAGFEHVALVEIEPLLARH